MTFFRLFSRHSELFLLKPVFRCLSARRWGRRDRPRFARRKWLRLRREGEGVDVVLLEGGDVVEGDFGGGVGELVECVEELGLAGESGGAGERGVADDGAGGAWGKHADGAGAVEVEVVGEAAGEVDASEVVWGHAGGVEEGADAGGDGGLGLEELLDVGGGDGDAVCEPDGGRAVGVVGGMGAELAGDGESESVDPAGAAAQGEEVDHGGAAESVWGEASADGGEGEVVPEVVDGAGGGASSGGDAGAREGWGRRRRCRGGGRRR